MVTIVHALHAVAKRVARAREAYLLRDAFAEGAAVCNLPTR
jgi:hypothetical protein